MAVYFNKGPWKLCDSGIDVNCEAGIIAICDDPNTNQHFNACLIAAAPEMYEALERLLRVASVELKGKRDDVLEQAQKPYEKLKAGRDKKNENISSGYWNGFCDSCRRCRFVRFRLRYYRSESWRLV